MALKYRKLRGKIIEKFGTQGNFANELKVKEQYLSRKLNGGISFTRNDIEKWCELLEIKQEEIGLYFFYE